MSTPDTNNIGVKLQSAGENLNTWGDPNLNNDLIVFSNLSSKWNPITINGDYSVSSNTTNYATTNPDEVAVIKLVAGTVSANFNFTLAGRHKRLIIWNATGFSAQIKLAATTGFSLPTGYVVIAATDGATDVYNVSPSIVAGAFTVAGQIHGVATGSASTDATNVAQVAAAIATANLPASSGSILIDINDTTANYPAAKLLVTANGFLSRAVTTPLGNEALTDTFDEGMVGLYGDVFA